MSRFLVAVVALGLVASIGTPSFAIKPLNDVFTEQYSGNSALKAKITEAKCNVCHVQGGKKSVRNPYGEALHAVLKETKFSIPDLKKTPKDEKLVAAVKAAMKKIEDQKPKGAGADAKTFGQRIKDGELPGGDKDGK